MQRTYGSSDKRGLVGCQYHTMACGARESKDETHVKLASHPVPPNMGRRGKNRHMGQIKLRVLSKGAGME